MQSIGNWDNLLSHLPIVTNKERKEATDYGTQTPLVI
jgi:hypothetical protein